MKQIIFLIKSNQNPNSPAERKNLKQKFDVKVASWLKSARQEYFQI